VPVRRRGRRAGFGDRAAATAGERNLNPSVISSALRRNLNPSVVSAHVVVVVVEPYAQLAALAAHPSSRIVW